MLRRRRRIRSVLCVCVGVVMFGLCVCARARVASVCVLCARVRGLQKL